MNSLDGAQLGFGQAKSQIGASLSSLSKAWTVSYQNESSIYRGGGQRTLGTARVPQGQRFFNSLFNDHFNARAILFAVRAMSAIC